MSRFAIFNVHLLCSGLNNEDVRQSAPLTDILHYTPTRRASSRYAGETGTRKPPQQRMRGKRLRTYTQPAQPLLLEHSFLPTPSPLCKLASWLLLGACSMYPGE